MFIARLYLAWAIALPSDRLNEPATTDRHTSNTPASPFRPTSHLSLSSPLMSRPICASLHHSYVYALLEISNRSFAPCRPSTPTEEPICVSRSSSVLLSSRLLTLRHFNEMQQQFLKPRVFLFTDYWSRLLFSRRGMCLNLTRIEQETMVKYSGGLKKFTVQVLMIH